MTIKIQQLIDTPKLKAGVELREQVLKTASKLFAEGGYENVSMRRIAENVGCSQMAMYRHFADKEALMQQLCINLYEQFTIRFHKTYDLIEDPKERLRQLIRQFMTLSITNPHHYKLVFLTLSFSEQAQNLRNRTTEPALAYFRKTLRLALPPNLPEAMVEQRMHQLLACLHGMVVLLITHPYTYKVTKRSAVRDMERVFELLLTVDQNIN